MKILLAGGAGYIGSHTAVALLQSGYDVVILDNYDNSSPESVKRVEELSGKTVSVYEADAADKATVLKIMKQEKPDCIIHFAGLKAVGESINQPLRYYRNNIDTTLTLLECMAQTSCKKIVFSSTCAVYGNPQYLPLDENHPKNPINPYGETKNQVEEILKVYDNKYGLKSVILRYFNASGADSEARIGEWHNPETHLIPNILKSVLNEGKVFKIFGDDYDTPDGTCVRDYVNVEDMAIAHRKAYEYLKNGNESNIFNIGTADGYSVKEVFKTAQKVTEKQIHYEQCARRAGDSAKLTANTEKAKNILGWQSQKTLEDSIKSAFEWEKKLAKL